MAGTIKALLPEAPHTYRVVRLNVAKNGSYELMTEPATIAVAPNHRHVECQQAFGTFEGQILCSGRVVGWIYQQDGATGRFITRVYKR